MATTNYPISNLTSSPRSQSTFLNDLYTDDVYSFNTSNPSSINLNLHSISYGDDADLYLYADTNNNGSLDLDGSDLELQRSRSIGDRDESINFSALAGNYFARVERDALRSEGILNYQLDLSATPNLPSSTAAPNLLPSEFRAGDTSSTLFADRTFYGSVGDKNTADVYSLNLTRNLPNTLGSDTASITLSGLSSGTDLDIRLIQDFNQNRIVDIGEVIQHSNVGSNSNESIFNIGAGNYYLQVYQYTGNTNYTLNFDYTYVPPTI